MKQLAILFFLFILSPVIKAQNITISSVDSTASVCFNDGSITVHPSGGSPPYTYSIISGPAVPNVTYPIPGGSNNNFADLHSGTYVVRVTDIGGHTKDVTVTVPGNYQFPILSYTTNQDTIFGFGSLGKPPYRFALSDNKKKIEACFMEWKRKSLEAKKRNGWMFPCVLFGIRKEVFLWAINCRRVRNRFWRNDTYIRSVKGALVSLKNCVSFLRGLIIDILLLL